MLDYIIIIIEPKEYHSFHREQVHVHSTSTSTSSTTCLALARSELVERERAWLKTISSNLMINNYRSIWCSSEPLQRRHLLFTQRTYSIVDGHSLPLIRSLCFFRCGWCWVNCILVQPITIHYTYHLNWNNYNYNNLNHNDDGDEKNWLKMEIKNENRMWVHRTSTRSSILHVFTNTRPNLIDRRTHTLRPLRHIIVL